LGRLGAITKKREPRHGIHEHERQRCGGLVALHRRGSRLDPHPAELLLVRRDAGLDLDALAVHGLAARLGHLLQKLPVGLPQMVSVGGQVRFDLRPRLGAMRLVGLPCGEILAQPAMRFVPKSDANQPLERRTPDAASGARRSIAPSQRGGDQAGSMIPLSS
jgi:hypothetical protein